MRWSHEVNSPGLLWHTQDSNPSEVQPGRGAEPWRIYNNHAVHAVNDIFTSKSWALSWKSANQSLSFSHAHTHTHTGKHTLPFAPLPLSCLIAYMSFCLFWFDHLPVWLFILLSILGIVCLCILLSIYHSFFIFLWMKNNNKSLPSLLPYSINLPLISFSI